MAPASPSPASAAALAHRLEERLRSLGTAERAVGAKAYLKSGLEFVGVDTPTLRREVKALLAAEPGLGRDGLLAHLLPLRQGRGDFERFARYADLMLEEREFFIRKAIGWVLRDLAKKRPALVAEWLRPRAHRASGVTVREAVKYLSEADREAILAAYRSGR